MKWDDFINQVVERGIEAAKRDYTRKDQKSLLEGSIAGFEACHDKSVGELAHILQDARAKLDVVSPEMTNDVWYTRGFYNEVEWVCNVVSAALYNQKLPVIINPTARGIQTAAEILGVRS